MIPRHLLFPRDRDHLGAHTPHDDPDVEARRKNVPQQCRREGAVSTFSIEGHRVGLGRRRSKCRSRSGACLLFRIKSNGLAVIGNGAIEVALGLPGNATIVECVGIIGVEADSLIEVCQRAIEVVLVVSRDGAEIVSDGSPAPALRRDCARTSADPLIRAFLR